MRKRLLSLIMAVMMVVVLVVPAAAATTDTTSDGTVTVYVTYGMFTEGGYDTAKKHLQSKHTTATQHRPRTKSTQTSTSTLMP